MKNRILIALAVGFVIAMLLISVKIYFGFTNAYSTNINVLTVKILGIPIYELTKSGCECKESVDTAFNFLKANGNRISGSISVANKDYIINYQDLQGLGMTKTLALPTLVALCSIALQRPVHSSMVILGDFSIGGTILKVENLASTLQVCLDSGAKKVLLPAATMMDIATVPPDLMSAFQLVPYSDPVDAVFKALGVE